METTNRPSHLDRLEIFCNDWNDRNDPGDHIETKLKSCSRLSSLLSTLQTSEVLNISTYAQLKRAHYPAALSKRSMQQLTKILLLQRALKHQWLRD